MASKHNDPLHNFHEHVYITDKCWLWTACLDKDGYGVGAINTKKIAAHRISWLLYHGDIKDGHYILHNCHNPSCVNPLHLRQGTQYDNIQDQIKLGTNVGKRKITALLNPDKVRYIRTSNKSIIELSTELSVSKHCIWDALHKRSWKDVN